MATLFTPYSDFLFTVAGILAAGYALALFAGRAITPLSGAVVAVGTIFLVLVVPSLWRTADGNEHVRADLAVPPEARHDKCFYDRGHHPQLRFVWWLLPRIPESDTFAVRSGSIDRACFQLSMLPRKMVRREEDPDWTLHFGSLPDHLREHPSVQFMNDEAALVRER